MTVALTALARDLFGPGVAVSVGLIADLQAPLWPEEQALLTRAVPKRIAEFTAGRVAARQVIAALGLMSGPVAKGPGGMPLWPAGMVGSISHGAGMCIAAGSTDPAVLAVGVDIEAGRDLSPELVAEICTDDERDWIAQQPDAPGLPLRLFGAKEAVYKAQYPLTQTVFGFDRLALRLTHDRNGFAARFTAPTGRFATGTLIAGRQGIADGFVLSVVVLRRDQTT